MNFISCGNNEISFVVHEPTLQNHKGDFILLLHGGSKTIGKDRFQYLQNRLAKDSIVSLAFDFSGLGNSSGNLEQSSLKKRIEETICVIRYIKEKYPKKKLSLYGVSMGGYIALAITQQMPDMFDELILHAPAAYAKEAHSLKFNEKFTKVLRRDMSWESSLSFDWLKNYKGKVLFLIGQNDPVIPSGIVDKYCEILENKINAKFISVPNMEHNIWTDKESSKKHRDLIYNYISSFIRGQTKALS